MQRISDKIKEIETYVIELEEFLPKSVFKYESNNLLKAACERYFEKIVEGVVDIAFIIIKVRKYKIPEEDLDAFNILLDRKIISEKLSLNLKRAKGMRNIIVHQYSEVDNELVYTCLKNELLNDVNDFIESIKRDFDA